MLIPESETEKQAAHRRHMTSWITTTRSPYHCMECLTYVGFRHVLRERTEECILGSELKR